MIVCERAILSGSFVRGSVARSGLWKTCASELIRQGKVAPLYRLSILESEEAVESRRLEVPISEVETVLARDHRAIHDQCLGVKGLAKSGGKEVQSVSASFSVRRLFVDMIGEWALPDFDSLARKLFAVNPKFVNLVLKEANLRRRFLDQIDRKNPDIVKFPCASGLREDVEEGVSAEMWLGELFWERVPCRKEDVLKANWLKVEDRGSHLHVIAWPKPFTSIEGEEGEVQRRLLKLLFGYEEGYLQRAAEAARQRHLDRAAKFRPDAALGRLAQDLAEAVIKLGRTLGTRPMDWSERGMWNGTFLVEMAHCGWRFPRPEGEDRKRFIAECGSHLGEFFRRAHGWEWGYCAQEDGGPELPAIRNRSKTHVFWPMATTEFFFDDPYGTRRRFIQVVEEALAASKESA